MISCLHVLLLVNCSAAGGKKKEGYRPAQHNSHLSQSHRSQRRRKVGPQQDEDMSSWCSAEMITAMSQCGDVFVNVLSDTK